MAPVPLHTASTLGQVLDLLSRLLNDADPDAPFTRYSREDLILYINEALREICSLRPEAFVITTELQLRTGAIQQLSKEYQTLVTVEESINGSRRNAVTKCDYRYARIFKGNKVRSVVTDGDPLTDYDVRTFTPHPIDDTIFYVEPPVPAGSRCRIMATVVVRGAVSKAYPHEKPVPIKPEYEPQLVDWVMQRALGMDHESSTARQQSVVHREAFYKAFGLKQSVHARVRRESEDEEAGGGRDPQQFNRSSQP